MASISSVSSSSSSIYGTRNVISGLASGLDTETLITNSVAGYKAKITALQQKQTITQWKQDAYRSIIDKMVAFTRRYTSYSSSTNLLSQSFFNRAVAVTTNGANAALATATGKTNSAVQLDGIKQLASAAKYTVSAAGLGSSAANPTITAPQSVDLSALMDRSTISGTMSIRYGNATVDLDFGELEVFADENELADAITKKLKDQKITTSSGQQVAASTLIKVSVAGDGKIELADKSNAGNQVYINSVSANMEAVFGISGGQSDTGFYIQPGASLSEQVNTADYLAGKTISVTLDGITKKVTIPPSGGTANDFVTSLQSQIDSAFGTGKITVGNEATDGTLKLSMETRTGSTLMVSSSVGEALGFGKSQLTSYLNTGDTLESLGALSGLTPTGQNADGEDLYSFVLNGIEIGSYTKNTAFETIMTDINNNAEAGVSVSYSKITNQFVFNAKETGEAGNISFGAGLADSIFGGGTFTQGSDAVFTATINGTQLELIRSSNVVDLDGLSVTLQGEFGYTGATLDPAAEAITFTSKTDPAPIVDAIRTMIEEYNALATEIKNAMSTQPARKSNGASYLPLTDEDRASMSESAVKAYEDSAKQGLLFGDSDLSSLYTKLLSAVTPGGADGNYLRSIGITTTYSEGVTTLSLDEDKLKDALEQNPDGVRDFFTRSTDNGAATDGIVKKLASVMDNYGSTSVATPGILVKRAGTKLSSLSLLDNYLQKQIDNFNKQIESWQTKMSNKVDYYTNKFTALEKLISQLNSQSSYFAGLTMGNSSY